MKSGFAYLKVFEELGTPEEIANARANIVYVMGVMGHYVGDCAQPLHTTVHHNGWIGPNPNEYTKWSGFHSWIDGRFVAKSGIRVGDMMPRVAPAAALALPSQADGRDPFFVAIMNYLIEQNKLVEPLYALEAGCVQGRGGRHQHRGPGIHQGPPAHRDDVASIWITTWKNAGGHLPAGLADQTGTAAGRRQAIDALSGCRRRGCWFDCPFADELGDPAGRLPWATIYQHPWLAADRLAAVDTVHSRGQLVLHGWVIGICGGFTTFSTACWLSLSSAGVGLRQQPVRSVVLCLWRLDFFWGCVVRALAAASA